MPKTAKESRYEKPCPDPRIICGKQEGDNGPNTVEGYLAVFGNVDHANERIRKGAFKKSLKDKFSKNGPRAPFMVIHAAYGAGARDVIGTIIESKEDDFGLWIKAEIASTDIAQQTYILIKEKHVKGLSVGYRTIKATEWKPEMVDGQAMEVRDLTELALIEGTVTPFPANELAGVTGFKSEEVAAITARLEAIEGKINQKKDEYQNAGNTEGKAATATPPAVSTELDKAANDLWIMSAKTRLERIRHNEDFERTPCPDGGSTP